MPLVLCRTSEFKTFINLKGNKAGWKIQFYFHFYSLPFSTHSTFVNALSTNNLPLGPSSPLNISKKKAFPDVQNLSVISN